jgi:BlaI family penicillinase repressor
VLGNCPARTQGANAAPHRLESICGGVILKQIKLSKFELQIMEVLWKHDGTASVRKVQESFPEKSRPAYTTVHTMMSRLETKKALRRIRKSGRAYIFEAMISRGAAQRRLTDEFLGLFGGRMQPVMAHFVETGKLTLEDVHEAEKLLRELANKEKQE